MFDLNTYVEQVDKAQTADAVVQLFSHAMSDIGWQLRDIYLFAPAHGKACDRRDQKPGGGFSVILSHTPCSQRLVEQLHQAAAVKCGAFAFEFTENTVTTNEVIGAQTGHICIPLRGPFGTLALACAASAEIREHKHKVNCRYVDLIAAAFYQKYYALALTGVSPVKLTAKEIEVLQAVATGQTKRCIAESMGVTNHAVDFHYRNIMKKYQVTKMVAAVVLAIQERSV